MSEIKLDADTEFRVMETLQKIDKVEAALKANDPLLEYHCSNILNTLREYEELVHLLPDDKIAVFMAGMQKWKNIKLVEEATAPRGGKRGKVTADML